MATSPTSFFFAILLFVSLCSSLGRKVSGDDALQGFVLAKAEDFRHSSICSESKVPGPYSLKVVHRHGPCSPARDDPPGVHEIIGQDARRVAHLHDLIIRRIRARGNSSVDALQASLPAATVSVHDLDYAYVATVGVGTPAREQTLMLDTASDVCWIQCEPCRTCYAQHQPIFDPRTSRSYYNVTCGAQACLHLRDKDRGCSENTCVYHLKYADNSSTTGFLATERLTYRESGMVLDYFVFGCGHTNEGPSSSAAGMLGLGRGFHSFPRQAADQHRRRDDVFSYCLPSAENRAGHLTFGRRAVPSPAYTRMVSPPGGELDVAYFVEFVGISVAGRWLSIGPEHFVTHGTVIDSGTVGSWLPSVAYEALRSAFREGMTHYRPAPPHGPLDTCYILTEPSFRYPEITLHFRGVDLSLKPAQVFLHIEDSVYCLAFTSQVEGQATIIGSTQQRGMEVIFDNHNHRIGFSTGSALQC